MNPQNENDNASFPKEQKHMIKEIMRDVLTGIYRENTIRSKYDHDDFVGISGLAEMLGVSKSTAYKISSKGIIPRYKPGGKLVLFRVYDILNYIESGRRKSKAEISEEAERLTASAESIILKPNRRLKRN